jgi:hypothetical protein
MTAARQQRKPWLAWATCLGLGLMAGLAASRAATTERIVVDWHTGLAISGYDPVAYFTDGKAMPGNEQLELHFGGAVWRFCNIGNREVFAQRPDVYMPQFGGYDPVAAARGVALPGNPRLWLIAGRRLYLFYNRAAIASFSADPERVIATAERKWPDILQSLTP